MGNLFSTPSPPPPPVYTPPPPPPTDPADAAAEEARLRRLRANLGTVSTGWNGLQSEAQDNQPKRKTLLGE